MLLTLFSFNRFTRAATRSTTASGTTATSVIIQSSFTGPADAVHTSANWMTWSAARMHSSGLPTANHARHCRAQPSRQQGRSDNTRSNACKHYPQAAIVCIFHMRTAPIKHEREKGTRSRDWNPSRRTEARDSRAAALPGARGRKRISPKVHSTTNNSTSWFIAHAAYQCSALRARRMHASWIWH